MSPERATLWRRNLMRIENKSSCTVGPAMSDSLSEMPLLDLAYPSKTTVLLWSNLLCAHSDEAKSLFESPV